MDDYIAVYLYDIKKAIDEVESFFVDYPMRYDIFEKDYLRRSAVERKAEIMGEAINRILKIQRDFILRNLFGREDDLVEASSVKNPYFKEELDETKQMIYG